jgi:glycosyltransferase involved in cell wall biosynthesis
MKERLALLTSQMDDGGAQRSMLKLAGGLAERGHPVDLVLTRAYGPYLAEVSPAVRIVDLGAPRVAASVPALVRYLRRERPVAMLSALDYVNIVAVWSRRLAGARTRLLVSERNHLSTAHRHRNLRRNKALPMLIRRFYPWADEIVAVSAGVADDLAATTGLSRDRIEVIYNPVVTPAAARMAQAPLDHPWFEPGEPPVILAVGGLRRQKDFGTLIEAFAIVRRRRPARLLIIGEGPERVGLEALVARSGLESEIAMPGFVANPYPYMARAAAFALSSRWEGLPGVLIEALFCGVPVVATDCPGGSREVLADGRYGRLVPVGDPTALAQALESALSGALAPAPRESWRPYEVDTVVDRYTEVLLRTEPVAAEDA